MNTVFTPADILLPGPEVDMTKWAVVACDQFTSQPEYWKAVEAHVGNAPSALRLILPEAELGAEGVEARIAGINAAMREYLRSGVLRAFPNSLFYIERTQSNGRVRRGLIGRVDLEQYDFTPGSGALVRATEGTVLERIPPRVRVRRDAPLELPHVMLLIDDPEGTVIEPLAAEREAMTPLYGFDLQAGGGHLNGWRLTEDQMERVSRGLEALCAPEAQARRYGVHGASPMLFAVGDGNHSLAAAKACWEEVKKTLPEAEWAGCPARYALAEVVNNHDPALEFEPIHRCLSGVEPEAVLEALRRFYPACIEGRGEGHVLSYVYQNGAGALTVPEPKAQLAVGTLQAFIDAYLAEHPGSVDYIHGDETAAALGQREGCLAFLLPAMGKEELFRTVMADGVLPRKTFSMGNAEDKRYYVEARKIDNG